MKIEFLSSVVQILFKISFSIQTKNFIQISEFQSFIFLIYFLLIFERFYLSFVFVFVLGWIALANRF